MTAEEIRQLWQRAEDASAANNWEQAESVATALVAALEHEEPTLELPANLGYGRALFLLAFVRLHRVGPQAAVDVFASAITAMGEGPAALSRGLVWINFARLFESLDLPDTAAGAAIAAIREIDGEARALKAEALDVLFESVELLHGFENGPDAVLPTLRGVLEAAEGAIPEASAVLVRVHQDLGRVLCASRRYREALPHARFMVRAHIVRFGDHSAEAADARALLALALDQTGAYKHAEFHWRRALQDLRLHRGDHHQSVTLVRQNLAELDRIRGKVEEAARQFRRLEEEDRARHPDVQDRNSQLLINFAQALVSLRRYDEAAEKLDRALEIRAAHGRDTPAYARVLLSLGQLALARGSYDEATRALQEAATVYRNAGDAVSAESALFEVALASIHLTEPVEAGRRVREMIRATQAGVGEPHPHVIANFAQLVFHEALALERAGWTGPLVDQLYRHVEELADLDRFFLVQLLSSFGERPLRDALDQRRQWQLLHLSLVMQSGRSQAAVDRAWRLVTRYRGAETKALRLRARRNAQHDPSAARSLLARVKSRRVDVDRELQDGDDPQLRSDLERLEDELADVEFQLAAATSEERLNVEFTDQDAPRLGLSNDSAVLVVATYLRLPDEAVSYAVFVAKGDAPVRLVDLGEATPIDEAITRYREAVIAEGDRAFPNENAWREPGLWLTRRVIDALRPSLDGVRTLRVLPDGALALLPLSALPTPDGRFVFDDFDITYDVSIAGMPGVMYEEDLGIDAPPVVIGAPKYTTGQASGRVPGEDDRFLAQFQSGERFPPLPLVEPECRAIAQLLGVSPVLGIDATEAAIISATSPEVLHVSTHGFYLSATEGAESDDEDPAMRARSRLADSLDRSGLALTGANDYLDGRPAPYGADDGILYAAEIADHDFMRTDLVTLSACQTGLGDVARGDGVHGLQRAFLSAGAKTVVCSLWEVPDQSTYELFTKFYTRLLAGEPRDHALHETVRELAKDYSNYPDAWGGFILVGRTDPLARFTNRNVSVTSIQWPELDYAESSGPAQRAEQLIARALRQAATGDVDGGIATLQEGLDIEGVPPALVARLWYSAAGILRSAGRHVEAALLYEELERRPDVPHRLRVSILYDAGTNALMSGDYPRAVEHYTACLALRPAPDDTAKALVNRAAAYFHANDPVRGFADLSVVIEADTAPPEQRAIARVSRANHRLQLGDVAGALADLGRVHGRSGAAPDQVASAHVLRGEIARSEGRMEEAKGHYRSARMVPGLTSQGIRMLAQLDDA